MKNDLVVAGYCMTCGLLMVVSVLLVAMSVLMRSI